MMIPYPGLRPFAHTDGAIFFGREQQTVKLLETLVSRRFVAVVGPSGCGKSSLVRAGMAAHLQDEQRSNSQSNWWVGMMRPGAQPFHNLAAVLLQQSLLEKPQRNAPVSEQEIEQEVLPYLRRGPDGLVELLSANSLPTHTNFLLLVDQFEDIFRAYQQGQAEESKAFAELLLTSARQTRFPIHIVTTMRSELLGDCMLFPGLPEMMTTGQFLVPLLTPEQQRAAILEPARLFGGDIEPALIDTLIAEMRDEPDQLPLLQHCLMRIWLRASAQAAVRSATRAGTQKSELLTEPPSFEGSPCIHLTMADYTAIGGFKHALSQHADEIFWKLSPPQQQTAEFMFRRLGDRRADRRYTGDSVTIAEVAAIARVENSAVIEIADLFRHPACRFLIPDSNHPLQAESRIAFGHESLMRQWPRLKQWVEREARSASLYRHLEHNAVLWQQGKAAVWRSPDLEHALEWQAREKPSEAWAARYGKNFEAALKFLRAGNQHRRRVKIFLSAFAILVGALVVMLAGWGTWERRQRIRTQARLESVRSTAPVQKSPETAEDSEGTLISTHIAQIGIIDSRGLTIAVIGGRALLRPGERVTFETLLEPPDAATVRIEYFHFQADFISHSPEYVAPNAPGETDIVVVSVVDAMTERLLDQHSFKIKIVDKR